MKNSFEGIGQWAATFACAKDVAQGQMVKISSTGTAPALGWSGLSANGSGGVKADASGHEYLVVNVEESTMMVTFVL